MSAPRPAALPGARGLAESEKESVACTSELGFAGVREFRTGGSGGLTTFSTAKGRGLSKYLIHGDLRLLPAGRVELFLPPCAPVVGKD